MKGGEEMKNNINKLLKEKGISIKRLAKETEMDYSTAYRIVHRKDLSRTLLETLVRIATVLKVDLEELYEKGEKKNDY
jgi:predicted transcriptional regulator